MGKCSTFIDLCFGKRLETKVRASQSLSLPSKDGLLTSDEKKLLNSDRRQKINEKNKLIVFGSITLDLLSRVLELAMVETLLEGVVCSLQPRSPILA
jgi:hypothetical protein